ncbi:MAG: AgmX/PglI C-terminal domain-containing protein [Kofleriaceae bacterium]|nr:AgmX/PglI C-terminal domain-containing protein [Kofleriaceae bacterium]
MTKTSLLVVVLAATAACGGKNKNDVEESGGGATIDTQATTADTTDRSSQMVGPEKMDEINRALQRKQMIVSRCLASAVESGDEPKNSHGKVTLEISISPSGQASKVNVIKSSFKAQSVSDCVVKKVEEIAFPELPKQIETSWTYAMEAN